mmetsp:Transcript_9355/g.15254  ORF Transcript_9355/g.15254 Transcript_9355/m.15254 type:complete len:189 (+) Transcript_9355:374-940(+)
MQGIRENQANSGALPPKAPQNQASQQAGKGEANRTVSAFGYQLLSFEIVNLFDEQHDFVKLEGIGYQIGYRFVERYVRNSPKFTSTLEVIKFLCKDLWGAAFGKHVDKLQTNHKGVYVLHDNNFSWVSNLDVDYRNDESLDSAKRFFVVPCGLLRGMLSNLGVKCTVRAEFSTLPACFFNIHIQEELL